MCLRQQQIPQFACLAPARVLRQLLNADGGHRRHPTLDLLRRQLAALLALHA